MSNNLSMKDVEKFKEKNTKIKVLLMEEIETSGEGKFLKFKNFFFHF